VNIKLGYCTRYRLASRSFLTDLIKFFSKDFHVHSLTYDYHLTAINRNLIPSSWSSTKHMTLTISKFLDEFVDFFSRPPLFCNNKVFKCIYEKTDYSVTPHKFGLIFDYMMFAKKKLNKSGEFNTSQFIPLDVNLDNNIGIFTIADSKSDTYTKYLVIKIENYSAPSIKKTTISKTESLQLTPNNQKQTILILNKPFTHSKLSSSSSSSSLMNQRTLNSDNSFNNLNQSTMSKQSSMQAQTKSTLLKTTNQPRLESYIKVICYYLCINKSTSSQISSTILFQNQETKSSSINQFEKDRLFIDKMVEESINVYKLETFWDNLMISMSSISDYLNESNNTTVINNNIPIVFSIQSEELEQILKHSEKIDALELDSNLYSFLHECYSIKDKIRNKFEFSFGRHFIFTSSDSCEYCLLLINEHLIKKFRCTVSYANFQLQQQQHQHQTNTPQFPSSILSDRLLHSSLSSCSSSSSSSNSSTVVKVSTSTSSSNDTNNSNSEKQLNSFILLKFDKINKMTHLWQINRIIQQQQSASENSISGSVKYSSYSKTSSNKYLSFVINNLMYVLWEGLFSNN
jgi:hypothetical protein